MSSPEPDDAARPSRPLDRPRVGPYARPASEVVRELASDPVTGLAEPEAERRLRDAGPNAIPRAAREGDLRIALRQFGDPLVWLLVAATAVSAVIGEQLDALVIAAILMMNALLGFVQEAGAERAIESLRDAVETGATVIRSGRPALVSSEALVAGDLVAVREGDRVPADLRVIASDRLRANESLLTGESAPVTKTTDPIEPGAPLADRSCMLYAGTSVTMGEGRGVVVAVAGATETGAIAQLAGEATRPATPLQRRMGRLSRIMVVAGTGITVTLFGAMLGQGAPAHEAFLVGVSVAVAAVPEGLAATVTIALAGGANRMARRQAIVRHLAAVETVGAATIAATDKTGTLTLNELRVVTVAALPGHEPEDVLAAGALASTAQAVATAGEEERLVGDPVDRAFMVAAGGAESGPPPRRLALVPFDPERKRLTAAYAGERCVRVVVKGAPEVLMARSRQSQAELDPLVAANRRFAGRGLRVLAVGEASVDTVAGLREDEIDGRIDVVGVVGLEDPLRDGASEAVRRARRAGVRVVMLTGDQPATAAAIASQLGIAPARLMTGAELGELSNAELRDRQRQVGVFARVSPQDKLRLVRALQSDGEVVVVTGDGVNDTPALRQADVGVAMGRDGTEAAREAADIVLTDDAFSSIVAAIEEGRRIAQNMRAFVTFLLSANLGEVLLFAGGVLVGAGVPMSVVQVLAVNLLTDGLPAVALAYDPIARETMTRGSPPQARLLVPGGVRRLLAIGGMVAGAAAAAYAVGGGGGTAHAQTMAYATIALSELAIVYSLRALGAPAWTGPANWRLTAAVAASVAVVVGTVYLPAAHDILGTASLSAPDAVAVALLASAPLLAAEAWKAVRVSSQPKDERRPLNSS
jgi:calcium-translocating P-type ATPase